jgi:hypothetical protein
MKTGMSMDELFNKNNLMLRIPDDFEKSSISNILQRLNSLEGSQMYQSNNSSLDSRLTALETSMDSIRKMVMRCLVVNCISINCFHFTAGISSV